MRFKAVNQEIDRVETDTVVLSFFEDERPLKGPVGLTDWRLCGSLSRLIMADRIGGDYGEPLLMPANHRMESQKVLVIGLGELARYDLERYRKVVEQICDALVKIQVTHFALPLPGVALSGLDPADAAELLGKAIQTHYSGNPERVAKLDVQVIAAGPDLKRINPVLARIERSMST